MNSIVSIGIFIIMNCYELQGI